MLILLVLTAISGRAQTRTIVIQVIKDTNAHWPHYMLLNPADTQYVDTVYHHMDMGIMLPDGFDLKPYLLDGYYELYENGSLIKAGSVKNGKRDGDWILWLHNGICDRWREENGMRQGYATIYTHDSLTSFTYYLDGRELLYEQLRYGRTAGRSVLFGAKYMNYDSKGTPRYVKTTTELWEEYNYQDTPGKLQYWMPRTGDQLILTQQHGRTVRWRYRHTVPFKNIELDSPPLVQQMPSRKTLPGSDSGYICQLLEVPATYPGGQQALQQFIKKELHYPADALAAEIEGKVYVALTISADGSISNPTIARSLHPSCDAEALRLVVMLRTFTPAQVDGRKVSSRMVVPVGFYLER